HITGTNGKTSTSRMIESLLRATGLRTGLLTSPHLERVTERIMIDGEPISDEAFARNWDDIRPFLLIVDAELAAAGEETLTFFEALTVLAFACFADAPVDVIVLEVGMGGEWDSTNVADGQVAVFTPIALDHTQRLGSTITEIARTKAGIIKPSASVVTAIQPIEALDELREAARMDEASLAIERVDFALESTTVAVGGQLVDIRGRVGRYRDVSCRSTATTRHRTPPSRSPLWSRSWATARWRSIRMSWPRDSDRSRPPVACSSWASSRRCSSTPPTIRTGQPRSRRRCVST